MKLSTNYTLFAESVIKDETKKLSFINIFDNVYAENVPTVQQKLVIIFGLKIDDDTGKQEDLYLFAYDPDDKLFIEKQLPLKVEPSPNNETQLILDISGMPILAYGQYKFDLGYAKDKVISSKSLMVVDKLEGSK